MTIVVLSEGLFGRQTLYDVVVDNHSIDGARAIDPCLADRYPTVRWISNRRRNGFDNAIHRWLEALAGGAARVVMADAFKRFCREALAGVSPISSHHFHITVELPRKAIRRGYSYAAVPNNWYNRKYGLSKFKIEGMGSHYLYIVLYMFIEKLFLRAAYRKTVAPVKSSAFDMASMVRT